MLRNQRNRSVPIIRANHRFTCLQLEQLESRRCLAFSYSGIVGGALLFEGDYPFPGDDHLLGIYASGGTIWWTTDFSTQTSSPFVGTDFNTGVAVPTAAAPIKITIKGYSGHDTVDFWGGTAAHNNMGGFPSGPGPLGAAVALLTFWGGDGDDTFSPPHGVAGPPAVAGPIILPVAGDANIRFLGGNGFDLLNNSDDPEFFDGDQDGDIVAAGPGGGGGDDILSGYPGRRFMPQGDI